MRNVQVETNGDNELISLYDVSRIFDRSIDAMRKYRSLRLIEPCKRVGRKDLYKKKDIIYKKYLIDTKMRDGKKLHEIAEDLRESEEELDIVAEPANSETRKLLIVEDMDMINHMINSWLREYFSEDKLAVYYAEDGVSGIKVAEKIMPDVIILDIILPILSGVEVYKKLENHPRLSHSKFIIMSGSIKFEPNNAVFLAKPLDMLELMKTVAKLTSLEMNSPQALTH